MRNIIDIVKGLVPQKSSFPSLYYRCDLATAVAVMHEQMIRAVPTKVTKGIPAVVANDFTQSTKYTPNVEHFAFPIAVKEVDAKFGIIPIFHDTWAIYSNIPATPEYVAGYTSIRGNADDKLTRVDLLALYHNHDYVSSIMSEEEFVEAARGMSRNITRGFGE